MHLAPTKQDITILRFYLQLQLFQLKFLLNLGQSITLLNYFE